MTSWTFRRFRNSLLNDQSDIWVISILVSKRLIAHLGDFKTISYQGCPTSPAVIEKPFRPKCGLRGSLEGLALRVRRSSEGCVIAWKGLKWRRRRRFSKIFRKFEKMAQKCNKNWFLGMLPKIFKNVRTFFNFSFRKKSSKISLLNLSENK